MAQLIMRKSFPFNSSSYEKEDTEKRANEEPERKRVSKVLKRAEHTKDQKRWLWGSFFVFIKADHH